jgi:hypothetical protein
MLPNRDDRQLENIFGQSTDNSYDIRHLVSPPIILLYDPPTPAAGMLLLSRHFPKQACGSCLLCLAPLKHSALDVLYSIPCLRPSATCMLAGCTAAAAYLSRHQVVGRAHWTVLVWLVHCSAMGVCTGYMGVLQPSAARSSRRGMGGSLAMGLEGLRSRPAPPPAESCFCSACWLPGLPTASRQLLDLMVLHCAATAPAEPRYMCGPLGDSRCPLNDRALRLALRSATACTCW